MNKLFINNWIGNTGFILTDYALQWVCFKGLCKDQTLKLWAD